jgi:general secretion pathway protein H
MRSARGSRSGFTLIELLVVIVIIGIVSAVVMLSAGLLGGADRELAEEARRLEALVELAEDEALMQGRDFGLEFLQAGYRFVEHDPQTRQWFELTGDELLRPRQLEEGLALALFLEDRRIELAAQAVDIGGGDDDEEDNGDEDERDRRNGRDDDEDYAPHVLILSSGDVTPFHLSILRESDGAEVVLATNPVGELEVRTDEQPAP